MAVQLQKQHETFMNFVRTSAVTTSTSETSSDPVSVCKEPLTAPVTKTSNNKFAQTCYSASEVTQSWDQVPISRCRLNCLALESMEVAQI